MAPRTSSLRALPAAPVDAHGLQLVRPFRSRRRHRGEDGAVLHLRPAQDATRTALCGVRVVPGDPQVRPREVVLCLDCVQERRALRAVAALPEGGRLQAPHAVAGA